MSAIRCSPGYRIEPLRRDHPRSAFHSGQAQVDDWLANKALQNQDKHLSATKVLIDPVLPALGLSPAAWPQLPTFSELEPAPGHGDGLLRA